MGLQGNARRPWWQSFRWAWSGIVRAVRQERHVQIHLLLGMLVVLAGFYYRISLLHWLILIGWISLVISLELINTAIELCVDLVVGTQYHHLAKYSKDIAAGAVLVVAIGALISGVIIFIPYILN